MSDLNGPSERAHYEEGLRRASRTEWEDRQERKQKAWNDRAMLIVTMASVVVALAAVGAAVWAAYEAHATRTEDERPFLTAAAGDVSGFYWPRIPINLNASGKTPSMSIRANCTIADGSSKAFWPSQVREPLATTAYGSLFPGQSRTLACGEALPFNNQNSVIAYGVVYYQNVNGDKYQTPFCQMIYHKIGSTTEFATGSCQEDNLAGEPPLE